MKYQVLNRHGCPRLNFTSGCSNRIPFKRIQTVSCQKRFRAGNGGKFSARE